MGDALVQSKNHCRRIGISTPPPARSRASHLGQRFRGNPSGFDGSTNITISVLDSAWMKPHGLEWAQTCFLADYTTDGEPTPFDLIQHGNTRRRNCIRHWSGRRQRDG